jgi:hypothetical protein
LQVRAVCQGDKSYRYAASGPFYVEIAGEPRISKASAQFFLDWTTERAGQVAKRLADERQRQQVLEEYDRSRDFWQDLVDRANAE